MADKAHITGGERKRASQRSFRRKLEFLLGQIVSQGELAERLRTAPHEALRDLGFTDAEVAVLGDVSFDIVLTPRRRNLLKPPCVPDDPTKTITIIADPHTVTGGSFLIDLEELLADKDQ